MYDYSLLQIVLFFMLSFPQDEHEKFLIEQLEAKGINIEWNAELVSFNQKDDHVNVITI